MLIDKLTLVKLYENKIMNTDKALEVLALPQVIEKLEFNQVAVQYTKSNEEFLRHVENNNQVHADYVYYDKNEGYLKGVNIDGGYKAKVNIIKSDDAQSKFIILDLL